MGFRAKRPRGACLQSAPAPGYRKTLWQRRLRVAGLLLLLSGSAAASYQLSHYLLDPAQFPLRHVRFQGELHHVHTTAVKEIVSDYLGENFFLLDIHALQDDLAAHPWVAGATIWRQWPDTLKVRLQERRAFARWGEHEMVDIDGVRFHPEVIQHPDFWPRLVGPSGHERNVIRAYRQASTLLQHVDLRLVQLRLDERRAWWMTLNTGTEIRLGRERFVERLQRFLDVYPHVFAERMDEIATIDLRYRNGFAVRWRSDARVTRSSQPQNDKANNPSGGAPLSSVTQRSTIEQRQLLLNIPLSTHGSESLATALAS